MKTAWFKGLNEEQKREMQAHFGGSAVLRTQLVKILRSKIESNNTSVRSKDAYNIANWAFVQADAVGYERALTEVISLLANDQSAESEALVAETLTAVEKPRRGRPPKVKPPVI